MALPRLLILLLAVSTGLGTASAEEEEKKEKVYCGAKNCYDVLGLTEKAKPSDIKKVYRTLSMEWHPDKNTKPGAKDRFAEIAQAYAVLSDEEHRRDYDFALKHPERRMSSQPRFSYRQYYRNTVDANPYVVIFGFLVGLSAIQYFSMKLMYEQALQKAKSLPRYKLMLKELKQAKLEEMERKGAANGKAKVTKKALKDIEVDESVLLEKVQVIGWRKPAVGDLLIVLAFTWPYYLGKSLLWQWEWYLKHTIRQEPLDDAEKEYLTQRIIMMSQATWEGLDAKKRSEWLSKELWIDDNAKKWRESKKFE